MLCEDDRRMRLSKENVPGGVDIPDLPGIFFPGVNRMRPESENSSPSGTEVKNA